MRLNPLPSDRHAEPHSCGRDLAALCRTADPGPDPGPGDVLADLAPPAPGGLHYPNATHLCPTGFLVGHPSVYEHWFSDYMTASQCAERAGDENATAWTMDNEYIADLSREGSCYHCLAEWTEDDSMCDDDSTDDDDFWATCDLQATVGPTSAPNSHAPTSAGETFAPTAVPTRWTGLPTCVCAESWTTDDGGTCNMNQSGCPSEACDTMDGDCSWCIVQNVPCLTAEEDSWRANGDGRPPSADGVQRRGQRAVRCPIAARLPRCGRHPDELVTRS